VTRLAEISPVGNKLPHTRVGKWELHFYQILVIFNTLCTDKGSILGYFLNVLVHFEGLSCHTAAVLQM
jgi:uncharacterized membrane protein YczE